MTVTAMPPTATAAGAEAPVKKSKKKLIIILVAVLALGGGGYMFMKPAPKGPPVPGDVVKLDPIQINLASAHYLRIGIALQLVAGAKAADGSKALDATIAIFSGLPMAEVNNSQKRTELKKELEKQLDEKYEHAVMGVYFTELVTQ
jgi:flagellar FliL protein